nr:hypothetical protein [Pseudomonadota bacterium]
MNAKLRRNALVLTVGIAALALAGCGGGEEETASPRAGFPATGGGLSVREAIESDLEGPLMVKGQLIETDGELRLCGAVAESYPPQCASFPDALRVEGAGIEELAGALPVEEADGVRWTEDVVSVLG